MGVSANYADLMSTLEVVTPLAFVSQSVLALWRNAELRFGQQAQALKAVFEPFIPYR
jgi:hypothetical protein